MKIAIYGAGKCGEYVLSEIQADKKANIICITFVDNSEELCQKQKYGISIINIDEFMTLYSENTDGVLIAATSPLVAQEMALSLLKRGFSNIFLMPEVILGGKLPILNKNGDLISYIKSIKCCKPVLPYIEYHVSDFCNLKCKGCGHFSNIVTEKKLPDINEFKESLLGLKKKFKNIKVFRLMGGEPFVNPDLGKFIYETKRVFPYSEITIVTNGLLFERITDETIKAIEDCNAVVDISQYPPTREMIEKIINFAEEKQIRLSLGEQKVKFMKQVYRGENPDYEMAYKNCISNKCHFLRGKYLYPCPAVSLVYENKDFLGKNIDEKLVRDNSFDLINGEEDGWEILKKITEPFKFCMHCSTKGEWFDWSISGREAKKEDWLV